MISINYDSSPKDSIYYTSALLYDYLKNVSSNYEDAQQFFKTKINRIDSIFYYSLDWLFILGKILEIKEGVIVCA